MLDSIYHDIMITLKFHFWRKNIAILLCTQRCHGRHNVSLVMDVITFPVNL